MATVPKGFFDSEVVKEYLAEKGGRYDAERVEYWLDPAKVGGLAAATAMIPTGGDGGKASLQGQGEIVCMDVGCWAGNGRKSDENHERHREFGVVVGNVAVLCSFQGTGAGPAFFAEGKDKALIAGGGEPLYAARVKPFLDHLSRSSLGAVQVDGAQVAAGFPDGDPIIHLFIGDLHLPVLTEKARTTLDTPHLSEWVPRAGRLDLSERVRKKAKDALQAASAAPATWWTGPGGVAATTVTVGGLEAWAVKDLFEEERIASWTAAETDGLMSRKEAEAWADYYVGKGGKKGAEIFQGAGADLVAFLGQLEKWRGATVHLVQTGDMMDFWIGMKRGFAAMAGGVVPSPEGRAFADFWYGETAHNGRSGPVVQAFERLRTTHGPVKVTLLYGNHDNYLARMKALPSFYSHGTVFAEHGHQSDSFNADEDAWKGWALTQLAFIESKVRDYEDPASARMTTATRFWPWATDPGARLQRMARAADVCMKARVGIYVLGHTHQKLLRKVVVRLKLDRSQVCESGYQCTLASVDREVAHAKSLEKAYQEAAKDSARRLKDSAERYAQQRIDEARRAIVTAKRELEEARQAAVGYAKARVEEAERKVLEAERALEALGHRAETTARQKAEAVGKQLLLVEQEMKRLAEAGEAAVRVKIMDAERRVAEARQGLVRLEAASEQHARTKLEQTRGFLARKLTESKTSMERARTDLVAAQAAGERWAAGQLQELKSKASQARSDVDAAIQKTMRTLLGR